MSEERMSTVPIPADVQAAIDAYLAARVDDATWTAYIDGLGPGVALDVATTLCNWATPDADAQGWIQQTDFAYDPTGRDAPTEPYGISACSASLVTCMNDSADAVPPRTILECESDPSGQSRFAAWTVTIEWDDYTSTGRVTVAEYRAWANAQSLDAPVIDPWAVAACRAVCNAWAPEWAREQSAAEADEEE